MLIPSGLKKLELFAFEAGASVARQREQVKEIQEMRRRPGEVVTIYSKSAGSSWKVLSRRVSR